MTKVSALIDGILAYLIVSGVLSISIAFFLPGWRRNLGAVVVSVALGSFCGFAVEPIESLSSWSYVISIVATLAATPLVAWMMHGGDMKALLGDLMDVYTFVKSRKGDRDSEE